MASLPILNVIENSQVSPPPDTIDNRSLSLTFFDIPWLTICPVHNLFFYEFPITKTHFIETIVPNLKDSLSITLQHFFPFVGNLILFPTPNNPPEIRYTQGDFVPFSVAECTLDFNDLTGSHPRDCDKFYPLTPTLGDASKVCDHVQIPIFSVQVTFFHNCGISIGMTNHHSLGDASTRFRFMMAWTSIARLGTDESFLSKGDFPLYDRVIKHPNLDEIYLNKAKPETLYQEYKPKFLSIPSDKVRATFVLTRTTINRLKKYVSAKVPTLQYISSFTVACGYIWSCIAKSRNDELEVFGFVVDCRTRLVPAVPSNYFGNCLATCGTMAKTSVLVEKDGFVTAAKLLGDCLHEKLNDKDGILKDAATWYDFSFKERPTSMITISGTPKFNFYSADFGWGKPKKHEAVGIDYGKGISLGTSKESNEDLEIGVCLSAAEMEAFVAIFNGGLEELS